jgi:hypothetical protein
MMWYSEGKRKENPKSSFVNMVVAGVGVGESGEVGGGTVAVGGEVSP